jgi:hypothetical protein
MIQLSATRCSCIAILCITLVSFAAITLCVASQRVFVVVYFVIDSVRKLLDTPSYHVLISPVLATCPTDVVFLCLITLTMFGEECIL